MTRSIRTACLGITFLLATLMQGAAVSAGSIAIAVIPNTATGAGASFNISVADEAKISFDLSPIPTGAQLESVTLRLVPTGTSSALQFIRIFNPDSKKPDLSIGSIDVPKSTAPVLSKGTGLLDALKGGATNLNLVLKTESTRASREYNSFDSSIASARPRLLITWKDQRPELSQSGNQLWYRGHPDDATPWRASAPSGALLSVLFSPDSVLTSPVYINDTVVVIGKDNGDTKLFGISPSGALAWTYPADMSLDDTSWKYLRLDEQGRLYAFRNDGVITVFEKFGPNGPTEAKDHAFKNLNLSQRPVISAGGLVTFLKNKASDDDHGNRYFGLSPFPALETLWQSPPVGEATAPVLSPPLGQQFVYGIGKDPSFGVLIFDNSTGEQPVPPKFPAGSGLSDYNAFHPPLAINAKPNTPDQSDWVYLAGFGQDTGILDGFYDLNTGPNPGHWDKPQSGRVSGCISPPVAKGSDPVLYCVQQGQFRAYTYDGGTQICASDSKSLSATSNIVADGAGRLYFWQENTDATGVLHGFTPDCKQIVKQPLNGIPAKTDGQDIVEIRAGENGVFYVTSPKQVLAIRITQTTTENELAPKTQYFSATDLTTAGLKAPAGPIALYANGTLSVGDLKIPEAADVTCTARDAITFAKGFSIAKGATLRCRLDTTAKTQ